MTKTAENEQEKIRELFQKYDINGNDTLEWNEFCTMIDELLDNKTLQEKTGIFREIDTNNSGMISFDEFKSWWLKQ